MLYWGEAGHKTGDIGMIVIGYAYDVALLYLGHSECEVKNEMVYKIVKDGEREVILMPNCCPWKNCDQCELLIKILAAVQRVLTDNPKWWK